MKMYFVCLALAVAAADDLVDLPPLLEHARPDSVDAAVGDVTVTQGTWGGSQVTGNLHVQAGAILSPGKAVLVADDSLLAIPFDDLDLDTDYDDTISPATMPSSTSDTHSSDTLDSTKTIPTSHPSVPTTAALSGSGDRNEKEATVLLDLILGLDDLNL